MFESEDRKQSPGRTPQGAAQGESSGGLPRPGLTAMAGTGAGEASDVLSLARVETFLVRAARVDHDLSDAGRVDQIGALEQIKGAVAAAQARLTVDLHDSQRTTDQARGLDRAKTARSVGTQIALARRDSPNRGNRHLGLAKALVAEMPHTLAALTAGIISEWQATVMVRATACLTAEDRAAVDADLAPRLGEMSDRRLEAAARAAADRIDPQAAVNRRARAEKDRRVTSRPAPDCMSQLSALLPVKDGVACHAALKQAADTARAAGDPRTRGQVMADTLVERVTGRALAVGADVEVRVVMGTDTFLGFGTRSGWVPDYGPIPADLAYAWAHAGAARGDPTGGTGTESPTGDSSKTGPALPGVADIDPDTPAGRAERARLFLRRMFSTPDQSRLVGMETGRREYTGLLAEFLTVRDQTCRTPYCDAPIRHHDHVNPHARGGPSSAANGQGLCEACNYLKEHPDWDARPGPGNDRSTDHSESALPHTVTWTTPTGHTYRSTAPPPLEE